MKMERIEIERFHEEEERLLIMEISSIINGKNGESREGEMSRKGERGRSERRKR